MRLRIRDLREDADYTQKKIAAYLNCDQSLYAKYENNTRQIPWQFLDKLADLYNTSVDYLICRTNIRTKYPRE